MRSRRSCSAPTSRPSSSTRTWRATRRCSRPAACPSRAGERSSARRSRRFSASPCAPDAHMPRTLRHLRWYIGTLLFFSTVINYIDRQTLSVLAPVLKTEFHWTNSDFALVLISFRVAYAVGQAVSGRWLDRVGTRTGLSLAVAFYSVSAMLGSLGNGLRSFMG